MNAGARHPIVAPELWIAERKALLARESTLTRVQDEIAALRRALPGWVAAGLHAAATAAVALGCTGAARGMIDVVTFLERASRCDGLPWRKRSRAARSRSG